MGYRVIIFFENNLIIFHIEFLQKLSYKINVPTKRLTLFLTVVLLSIRSTIKVKLLKILRHRNKSNMD